MTDLTMSHFMWSGILVIKFLDENNFVSEITPKVDISMVYLFSFNPEYFLIEF